MARRALITGITGQDGPYLAKLLLEKGYKVFGTYRRVSTPNFWRLQQLDIIKNVTLIPSDLGDMASLLEAVTIADPDEIYNLAAQSFVGASFDQPLLTAEIDASGSTRFLEIIRHLKKDIKFYQASTSELYGASPGPQDENTPMIPSSPYATAKLFSFHMTKIYRQSYGMFTCNGILFNHECVSENTPVITRDKRTEIISIGRIKDLRRAREKGRNVQQWCIGNMQVWDGEQFADIRLLTATRRKRDEDKFRCKTINTRHGIVETTNHHNMLAQDNTKVKAESVDIGHALLHKEFPLSQDISVLSKEEAVFIGMMVGDGYVSKDGKGQFSNNDKAILELVEVLWEKIALGTVTLRNFKTEYGHITQAKLNGNNKYLRLLRDEIYTYDGFKKIPDRILNGSKEIKQAFLVGYNSADGLKSNKCTYEFKNFKTDSILLAQGLLFLISQTTGQGYNTTFEPDEKNYGYYSINLLSPVNNGAKQELVEELLEEDMSQREICRETGISRTFIRKIQWGGQAQLVHHLSKEKEVVKKMVYHNQQPEWVYDLETESGKFMAGVGTIVVSNSPLRGLEFVTRKIANSVAKIKLGLQQELHLGNLEAKRDWGYAPEYVKAMWLVMQHHEPMDFVIATGETHSVGEFAEEAFGAVGLDAKDFIVEDKRLRRPLDVSNLCGNPRKAAQILGWKSKTTFKQLVKLMVEADVKRWQMYLDGRIFPWDAPNYSHEMDIISRNVVRDSEIKAKRANWMKLARKQ